MSQVTLSLAAPPLLAPAFRETLGAAEFSFDVAPYAFWRARGPGCTVVFYQKGKVVLQGPNAHTVAALLDLEVEEPKVGAERFDEALAQHPDPPPDSWFGSDETGKGDYFGPLVVVAFRLERKHVALAAELGAADSKRLSDARVLAMAPALKQLGTYRKVVVGPEAYNRLYEQVGNLNRLLAWAHARAILDLVAVAPVDYGLTDQFADPGLIRRRLKQAGCTVRFDQRPRAEEDPAVAVASILARHEFLWGMKRLSEEAGFTLPKGAGAQVITAGKRLVAEHGRDALGRFAKLHFVTTKSVLPANPGRGA